VVSDHSTPKERTVSALDPNDRREDATRARNAARSTASPVLAMLVALAFVLVLLAVL
jgi:hypothetical protein